MSQPAAVPGAEPYRADGGPIGVVVSHGFTGSPVSMRPWAEHLAAAGFTVRLPLLPGHGTNWQDMNTTTWTQWYAEIEAAYTELAGRCEQVFAVGLSMGGTLITKLAEDHPDGVTGLVMVNPAFGLRRFDAKFAKYVARLMPSRPGIGSDIKSGAMEGGYDRVPLRAFVSQQQMWRIVVGDLAKVVAPIQLFTSRVDHVLDSLSAELLRAGATSTTIDQIWLENSYHVATMDNDAAEIFDGSIRFINAHARAQA